MKRFLTLAFALLMVMVAVPATAQVNYTMELQGGKYGEWLPLPVQCAMTDYVAPWGSILDREDRDVMLFGVLKPHPTQDGLVLTIEWIGNSSGYAPTPARPGLHEMYFPWHEEMQAYVAMVVIDQEKQAFQALTVENRDPVLTWRIGYFKFDTAGYPFWPIALFPYQEYECKEKEVTLWRHRSSGQRRK